MISFCSSVSFMPGVMGCTMSKRWVGGVSGGLVGYLTDSFTWWECVCGRQRPAVFLEMPLHWPKHPSNMVPPMTEEHPVVWRSDVKQKAVGWAGVRGSQWQHGGDTWVGGGIGQSCFGLRLQTPIEIPQHDQPVIGWRVNGWCTCVFHNSKHFHCENATFFFFFTFVSP